jgi:histidyl-tRNA synthetase
MNGSSPADSRISLISGTEECLPTAFLASDELQTALLDRFSRAGYRRLRTPILEPTELHERTSGARIVSKLFRVAESHGERPCLRPEWTASIVRAFAGQDPPPPLPWRVSYAGPVFRQNGDGLVEFTQVGVELLGAPPPAGDAEVIWLADWAAAEAGLRDVSLRIGHIGVILEVLRHSGLPETVHLPLVERLSQAAVGDDAHSAEDRVVAALDRWLSELSEYLETSRSSEMPTNAGASGALGIDDLFTAGRRHGRDVLERRARKWELGHSLSEALRRFGSKVHLLADLRGPAPDVLETLRRDFADMAPDSVAKLGGLLRALGDYGISAARVELDLGFGRGIGFYSQMVFELLADVPNGSAIAVCGGGRYDGLAQALGGVGESRGVGFAFGLERLSEALRLQGGPEVGLDPRGDLVLATTETGMTEAIRWTGEQRRQGNRAVLESGRPLSEAKNYAQQLGLTRVVVIDGAPGGPKIHPLGPAS